MLELTVLTLLAVVAGAIVLVIAAVVALVKLLLWVVFFPIRLVLGLLWVPVGLILGALGVLLGIVVLPLAVGAIGIFVIASMVAAFVGFLIPVLPLVLFVLLVWALVRGAPVTA